MPPKKKAKIYLQLSSLVIPSCLDIQEACVIPDHHGGRVAVKWKCVCGATHNKRDGSWMQRVGEWAGAHKWEEREVHSRQQSVRDTERKAAQDKWRRESLAAISGEHCLNSASPCMRMICSDMIHLVAWQTNLGNSWQCSCK